MAATTTRRAVRPNSARSTATRGASDATRSSSSHDPTPQPNAKDATAPLWTAFLGSRSQEAFAALVAAYAPFVASVAARMSRRLPPSVDPDDLCSAGSFGLMDAIGSFDPSRGVKFQTFALKRILGAMNDSLRAQDIAPRLARRRETLVKRARDDFRKRFGRGPTEEELLRLLHTDAIEARAILDGAEIPVLGSISGAGDDSEAVRDIPEVADDATVRRRGPRLPLPEREVQRWLGRGLSRSERLIIWLYYFEDLTMREIGQTLGICEGRVSQIHALLLERLRARMTREQEVE